MNKVLPTIQEIQKELNTLAETKTLAQAQRVILSVVRLLDDSVSLDDSKQFQLFNVDNQKISANAQWFFEDNVVVDRRAIYKINSENNINIDFKLYGITKPSKRTISWIQALTPNFEDEPFNSKFNVGIDFVVPKSVDKVIIVLSSNYVVRTLELKGTLTATFQEILAKWASISDFSNKKEVHSVLWESFDLQPLNKKFYAGISERFITLRQYLTKESILDDKHASLFANRLLGRVIFCWFLDKKGVINPDRKYFDSHVFPDDSEYYRKNLENLFFGVLNTPIADREYKDDVTPFLNGGLFEARDTDLYKNSRLSFPKNYFDDLFDFLTGYNFTTDESTSQFQQVAIDPEMLGRIFENLLAEMTEETGEQARKAKGAFYTPREIVDYMCRESLREYLKTKIPEDQFRDQRFVQLIDAPDKDFQDQDHNWRRDWKPYKDGIIKALDELKVLDPACGSGAFPIGMLQLLVRVYERLEPRFDTYKAKLQIIERNIFGIDIEPMAVEIARLRAWLSIIVDEEADSKKIKPLPNLEFKFVCANTLVDLDRSGNTTFGDDPKLAEKLQEIRDGYFNTESLNKKKKLRADYSKLVDKGEGLFGESIRSKQLKTYRPFDNEWSSDFFNAKFMFGVDLFDVIIGNPPYVSLEKVKEGKDLLKKEYRTASSRADLYCVFFERGLALVREESGLVVFITSNKWMRSGYGADLRKLFAEKDPLKLLDLGGYKVFDSAVVDTSIFLIRNASNTNQLKASGLSNEYKKGADLRTYFEKSAVRLKNISADSWFIGNQSELSLKSKIEKNGTPIKDWDIKINFGIKTGFNEAFIITQEQRDHLVAKNPKSKEIIKPILRGRDIERYTYKWAKLWMINPHNGYTSQSGEKIKAIDIEEYPAVKEHLDKYITQLTKRADKGRTPYNLRNCAYLEDFEKDKLVWIELADNGRFAFVESGMYTEATTFLMTFSRPKYLAGLLNSSLVNWYFDKICGESGVGTNRWKKFYVEEIPIPEMTKLNEEKVADIESYVDHILSKSKKGQIAQEEIDEIEKKIDSLVYDLYGLNDDEIRSIVSSQVSQ